MKVGDIVYGRVTNILGYGAFVQVDEYDGLIHISEFSDHFVRDIKDFVQIGDEIKLSKYGKEIIYRVVEVPWTGLEETKAILKNGKRYDVLGRQVNKDYKGGVLMNNAKYLQK